MAFQENTQPPYLTANAAGVNDEVFLCCRSRKHEYINILYWPSEWLWAERLHTWYCIVRYRKRGQSYPKRPDAWPTNATVGLSGKTNVCVRAHVLACVPVREDTWSTRRVRRADHADHGWWKEGHSVTYPTFSNRTRQPACDAEIPQISLPCRPHSLCVLLEISVWFFTREKKQSLNTAISSMSFGAEGILYRIPPPKLCKSNCASKAICHIKRRLQIYV